jgi:RND family efflux transporter MFP subunit
LILLGVVAVVAAGAGAGLLTQAPRPRVQVVSAPPPQEQPRPASAVAQPREFLGVVLSGESVDLAPKTEGRVQAVHVKVGQKIDRGTVVAEIDVRSLRQALDVAEAALGDAQQRLARRKGLAAGVLSQEELSNAKMIVLEKRGRVDELRALVADARVRAPFEGIVSARYLDAGAMAGPGHPIARLVGGSGDVRVRFALPEDEAARVAAGDRVRVTVSALDRPLPAKVESVSPEVDAAARMVFAVARLDISAELARRLSAGMVARVAIDTNVGERIAR